MLWGSFSSKRRILDADLLRKSGPTSRYQVPETLALGNFENMATPVLFRIAIDFRKSLDWRDFSIVFNSLCQVLFVETCCPCHSALCLRIT